MSERSLRVLLVDDEPSNRALAEMILRAAGHAVTECADGRIALDLLLTQRLGVDLVVLDIRMPGNSGLEVCRALRACVASAALPILCVSALAGADDVAAGLAAGADGYLVKPFRRQDLLDAIERVMAAGHVDGAQSSALRPSPSWCQAQG